MTIALMTLARRADSGWIAYGSVTDGIPAIFLMTGDGASVRKITPEGYCGGVPQWSPDGAWIAFSDLCGGKANLLQIRPGGSEMRLLTTGIFSAEGREWSHDGQFLGATRYGSDLYIVKAKEGGERLLLADYVFARWSADGQWIYARPAIDGFARLDRVHVMTGRVQPLPTARASLIDLNWSSAAEEFALVRLDAGGDDIIRMAPDASTLTPIPIDPALQRLAAPHWSPDSAWIAFLGGTAYGQMHVYRTRPDGSELERLSKQPGALSGLGWSPDGEWLIFDANYEGGRDIYRLRADGASLERLASGFTPQYAPVSGMDWHPALMLVAITTLFAISCVGTFRR